MGVLTDASDAKYRAQDYKVPVEGGEIAVRVVIPGTGDEEAVEQKYPFLFWTRGGGQFSFHNLCFVFVLNQYIFVSLSRIHLWQCRSRRLFHAKPFYRSSRTPSVEYRSVPE